MTVTTGNFQDLVQLSADTLYHLGPMLEVGNSAASTVTHGFSNSAGELHLAASQTGNQTIWMPQGGGTLLSNINVSAGTTSNNLSAITFSNSNNVSFGLNGSVVTASAAAGSGIAAIAAGTQTATSGTVVYSNSNNISFGMSNSSIVTASYNFNLSAGTTSNNLNAVTFSNSNNVSFGLNGSTVTASATVASTQASINLSAGTTSNLASAFTFSNSNGVSFGLNASTLTASHAINVSAGTTSNNLSAVTFSNSNNVSFGLNGSTVTASATVASTQASINLSAGTTSNLASAFTFSNSNNVSFGLNGSTVTASATVASTQASINLSAGTTSNLASAFTFSNSNGISFGLNASTVTAVFGGISSWSNGQFATAQSGGQGTLFFQPIIVPYAITVTNLLWLASQTAVSSNSSGGLSVKAGLYVLSGGTQITLVSTGSTNLTFTSGAALSSNTGINFQQMSVASWALTPGPYLFGFWVSTQNSASMSFYGEVQQPAISSGQVAAMSNLMLKGYSQATTNALPSSFGITNTASYIRTGATAAQQPTIIMQGT
jgi:hypothetical protein